MTPTLATADLVLIAVAAFLVAASLVSVLWSVTPWLAFGAGSLPASGTIGYALFYDPPQSD